MKAFITNVITFVYSQLELRFHALGEQPLILQDKFISLNASHYSLYHLSPLAVNGVQFELPTSLEKLLRKHQQQNDVASISDLMLKDSQQLSDYENLHLCFQARALSFPSNPFAFLSRDTDLVSYLMLIFLIVFFVFCFVLVFLLILSFIFSIIIFMCLTSVTFISYFTYSFVCFFFTTFFSNA